MESFGSKHLNSMQDQPEFPDPDKQLDLYNNIINLLFNYLI